MLHQSFLRQQFLFRSLPRLLFSLLTKPVSSHTESSSSLPPSVGYVAKGFLGECSLAWGPSFLCRGRWHLWSWWSWYAVEAGDDDDYIADVIVAQGAWDPWRQLEIEVIFDQDLSSFSCIYDSSLIFIYFQLFSSFNLLLCMIDILRFGLVESTVWLRWITYWWILFSNFWFSSEQAWLWGMECELNACKWSG